MITEYLTAMKDYNNQVDGSPQNVIRAAERALLTASYDEAESIFKTAPYDYLKTLSLGVMLNRAETAQQVLKVFNASYVGSALFNRASRKLALFEAVSAASL